MKLFITKINQKLDEIINFNYAKEWFNIEPSVNYNVYHENMTYVALPKYVEYDKYPEFDFCRPYWANGFVQREISLIVNEFNEQLFLNDNQKPVVIKLNANDIMNDLSLYLKQTKSVKHHPSLLFSLFQKCYYYLYNKFNLLLVHFRTKDVINEIITQMKLLGYSIHRQIINDNHMLTISK